MTSTAPCGNRELTRKRAQSTIVLGIETSCDETAASVVMRDGAGGGRILSSLVRSQMDQHREFGGVVPEIAARAHIECLDQLVRQAMREAGVTFAELSAVAVTAGPGLIGGLLVGVMSAKAIALVHDLDLIAINHLEGHALTVGLTEGLKPPYLLLLVSGGHSQILAVHEVGRYERLGTTIDDALGEAFDKTAKILGLGFPGGPAVERWAEGGNPERFALPRPMKGRKAPHFSFAGLKTALRVKARDHEPLSDEVIRDLCASFEAAACDAVCDRVARAMAIYETGLAASQASVSTNDPAPHGDEPARQLVVAGGVAANRTLRAGLAALAEVHGYRLHAPPLVLCGDNAAMIAWAGAERHARGLIDGFDFTARARWPLDPDAPPAIGAGVKA